VERCRSGRTGRSRKPLSAQAFRGFESLSLRQLSSRPAASEASYADLYRRGRPLTPVSTACAVRGRFAEAPAMSAPRFTLYSWPIPFRAQAARHVLAHAGAGWEEPDHDAVMAVYQAEVSDQPHSLDGAAFAARPGDWVFAIPAAFDRPQFRRGAGLDAGKTGARCAHTQGGERLH
jgi:hypothetical protein